MSISGDTGRQARVIEQIETIAQSRSHVSSARRSNVARWFLSELDAEHAGCRFSLPARHRLPPGTSSPVRLAITGHLAR